MNKSIIKIETSWYNNSRGLYTKKAITYLRRQTKGYHILEEDCRNSSSQDVITRIVNLDECEDGIYKVITCNEILDRETGYVDDYNYRLIPYELDDSINISTKSVINDISNSLDSFMDKFTV